MASRGHASADLGARPVARITPQPPTASHGSIASNSIWTRRGDLLPSHSRTRAVQPCRHGTARRAAGARPVRAGGCAYRPRYRTQRSPRHLRQGSGAAGGVGSPDRRVARRATGEKPRPGRVPGDRTDLLTESSRPAPRCGIEDLHCAAAARREPAAVGGERDRRPARAAQRLFGQHPASGGISHRRNRALRVDRGNLAAVRRHRDHVPLRRSAVES